MMSIADRSVIDGHDIRDFQQDANLRDAFGMVLQDTWLFKGTIMENIRYGRLDATDEEVIAAAKAAHAHQLSYRALAGRLPDGIKRRSKQRITGTKAAS